MGVNQLQSIVKSRRTETYQQGLSGNEAVIAIRNSFCLMEGFSDQSLEVVKAALTYDNEEAIQAVKQAKIMIGMAFRYRNFKKIEYLKALIKDLESKATV